MRSTSASSGRDATSVLAISERDEHKGFSASFENVSEKNKTLQELHTNIESLRIYPGEVIDFLVPWRQFEQQPHTRHMMKGETAPTNQNPEFHRGRIVTPRGPPSHQHQNMPTQISKDKNLPKVEFTPRYQISNSNSSINRLD